MYDRIAVVIRGHLRVWDWTKHNIFYYYDQLAATVDYYLVTWDDGADRREQLLKDFEGKNLVVCLELPYESKYANSKHSPSWFAHHAVPYMQGRTYDAVFDTRTDSLVEPTDFSRTVFPSARTIHITYGVFYVRNLAQINDINFMSDMETYKLLSDRYTKPHDTDRYHPAEAHLLEYCIENNISISTAVMLHTHVVRPDICELDIHPLTDIWPHYARLRESQTVWLGYSTEKQMAICEQYAIPFSHYQHKVGRPN
jgi:hypothetical protein